VPAGLPSWTLPDRQHELIPTPVDILLDGLELVIVEDGSLFKVIVGVMTRSPRIVFCSGFKVSRRGAH